MNGELAQIVALATHGNTWLRQPEDTPPPALDETSPMFHFARSIGFVSDESAWPPPRPQPATGVAPWYESMRERGIERLWLVTPAASGTDRRGSMPEHVLTAFAGGGSWYLIGTGRGATEGWSAAWDVGGLDAADPRIWDVVYTGRRTEGESPPAPVPLAAAHDALAGVLSAVERFATRHELTNWAELFGQALAILRREPAAPSSRDDLFPPDYPAVARRLAAASSAAWVFGGMGSWNDVGFGAEGDQREYDRLSADLHAAILGGLASSVNATL